MHEFRLRPSMTLLQTQLSEKGNEIQPLKFVSQNSVGHMPIFLRLIFILAQMHVGSRPFSAQITHTTTAQISKPTITNRCAI